MTPEQRRDLAGQDSYFLLMPLDPADASRSVAAHARKLARLLRDPGLASPSGAAVGHLVKLYDRSASTHPPVACKKGCHHCCTQKVSLTAPEVFFLASQVSPALAPALAEAAEKSAALAQGLPGAFWPRCPLLQDGACGAYGVRPLGCHSFVSVRLEACLALFEAHQPADIPMPAQHVALLQACRILLYAAIRAAGLPAKSYELNSALARALTTEDAERRWLSGEDVLAGLEDQTPIPPASENEIAKMAAFVEPTL